MRILITLIALLLTACTSQQPPRAEPPAERAKGDEPEKLEVKIVPVAGALHMLEGRGGNIAVLAGDDGVLIVDDQVAGMASAIQRAIASLSDEPLRWVINTHWHRDHTGTNADFGRVATIVAHENVRKRLSTPQTVRGSPVEPQPRHAWPVVTYEDEVWMHVAGDDIRILHVPGGHTDGDSFVFFTNTNAIHAGDEFFAGRFPFVDLDSGGNAVQLEKNIEALLAELPDDVKIIPGHGPLSTKADLADYHAMLEGTIAEVKAQKDAGKAVDEIRLDEKWAPWGTGFIKTDVWIRTIHASL